MQDIILKLYVKALAAKNLLKNEDGQDLIEYALVVSLIAFAAVSTMSTLAIDINAAFSKISSNLVSATA